TPHAVEAKAYCTWWFYLLRLEQAQERGAFVQALRAEGVEAGAGYLSAPLYRYPVFENHHFFGGRWPVKEMGLTQMDYREVRCPVAEEILKTCVYIKLHEGMSEDYIDQSARAIHKVAGMADRLT